MRRSNPVLLRMGTGVRVSLFVSGCRHHCKECFNEETWDFSYGKPFTKTTEDEIVQALAPSYIAGLTLLGGDPGEPENQQGLLPLLQRIKKNCRIKISGHTVDICMRISFREERCIVRRQSPSCQ